MGYCPQDESLFDFLLPTEHFALFGAGQRLSRRESIRAGHRFARSLGWDTGVGDQVRRLSGGTRQKLNLAVATLGDPDLLLLDEPYQGFDRGTYVDFWEHVFRWRDEGKAVVIVTHMLNSLDRVDAVLDLTPAAQGVSA